MIAEDVHAQQPHPPFPASIKDGYAVIGKFTCFQISLQMEQTPMHVCIVSIVHVHVCVCVET